MIKAERLIKEFYLPQPLRVVDVHSLHILAGEWVSLVGASGSGKSTLLALLAGLETPTSGNVTIDGVDLSTLNQEQRARLRAQKMGFVFQSFRLVPTLTARENVRIPLEILAQVSVSEAERRVDEILKRVGVAHRADHYPGQLSGGEQQRVAVARAFVGKPKVLFADEPTGNLDSTNGQHVLDLLSELHREEKTTVVVVTHDLSIAQKADRILSLKDGRLQ